MLPIIRLFREKQYAKAEEALRKLVQKFPNSALYRYNLAAALARLGRTDAALESLTLAIDYGFENKPALEHDPDLASLRGHARFKALVAELDANAAARVEKAKSVPVRPFPVEHGRALVSEVNTSWIPHSNVLVASFAFDPKAEKNTVRTGKDEVARSLNEWFAEGRAAGNHGDLYDNRDRGHSSLSRALFPQLAYVEYGAAARNAGVDYGANTGLFFNAITFGNSSTALTHSFAWRSQARLILSNATLAGRAGAQYQNNQLYVYPEHRDHDPDHGDLMPANTPYFLISQGSSGCDQPFLKAVGAILAAFQPKVKSYLRRYRLIMPTVQMIFRMGQKQVLGRADYLSAKAHPSVFAAGDIDLPRMIGLANNLKAETVPPMVALKVVEADKVVPGIDYFAPTNLGEDLFVTPSAIARVVRSTRYMQRLVVSASDTKDPNGRPLRFHWVVLSGDKDRTRITPTGPRGEEAEIRIPWHDRHSISTAPGLQTDRVDIGVFADNGETLSAPAFVSFLYPGDQARTYDEKGRPRCIDYHDARFRKRYVDPLIFPARDWRDCYEYDAAGNLIGWNRISGGSVQRFTWDGGKVVDTDSAGRPVLAEKVKYEVEATKSGRPRIVQMTTGTYQAYRYRSAADRVGEPEPAGR